MKSRIYYITYLNLQILYTDWRNIRDDDEFIDAIRQTSDFVIQQDTRQLLEIIDVRDSFFSLRVFQEMKEAAFKTCQYNKLKVIVANLTPTRLAMLSILNAFANEKILAFANLEDARDWIVKTERL